MGICDIPGDGLTQPTNSLTAGTDVILGLQMVASGAVFCKKYFAPGLLGKTKRVPKLSDLFFGLSLVFMGLAALAGVVDHSTASIAAAAPYWHSVVIFGILGSAFFGMGSLADYCLTIRRLLWRMPLLLIPTVAGFVLVPRCNWSFIAYSGSQLPVIVIFAVYGLLGLRHSRVTPLTNLACLAVLLVGVVMQAAGSVTDWHLQSWPDFDFNVVFHFWEMALFAAFHGLRLHHSVRDEHATALPAMVGGTAKEVKSE